MSKPTRKQRKAAVAKLPATIRRKLRAKIRRTVAKMMRDTARELEKEPVA